MRASLLLFLCAAACGSEASNASLTFDPCTPTVIGAPTATAAQLASIDDAIAMWQVRGVAGLARGDVPAITVEFRDAAESIYGFYDDSSGTLYINLRLVDPSFRAITIAHELGHALGLPHVAPEMQTSVMNPGNLTTPPNESDGSALTLLWGACSERQ